jgi:hypothetical protein
MFEIVQKRTSDRDLTDKAIDNSQSNFFSLGNSYGIFADWSEIERIERLDDAPSDGVRLN